LERREQALGHGGDLADGTLERVLIGERGLVQPTHLSHVLKGRGADFFGRRGRLEAVKDANVAAHGATTMRETDLAVQWLPAASS
jgi:hypothetical protein